jgi:hypothetical protein
MLPQVSQDRLRLLLDVNNAIVSNLGLKQMLLSVFECLRTFIAHDFAKGGAAEILGRSRPRSCATV